MSRKLLKSRVQTTPLSAIAPLLHPQLPRLLYMAAFGCATQYLLSFGDQAIDTPTLTLPHPRMHQRAFVLVPLAEIAPDQVSPEQLAAVAGQAIQRL